MYLLRLDDASEHWNRDNWHRMHDLLCKYGVKPIVAIIPHNEDPKLLKYPIDNNYSRTIRNWIEEGWTPALHGYNHVLDSSEGGLNPVNPRSEFVNKSLEEQKKKIREGLRMLNQSNIFPEIFVAPAHTFDENTLLALQEESDIRVISDTIATDTYYQNGFYYIPLQSGKACRLPFETVSFCYHPNIMKETHFLHLDYFLGKYNSMFTNIEHLTIKKREYGIIDKTIRLAYFYGRKIRAINRNAKD